MKLFFICWVLFLILVYSYMAFDHYLSGVDLRSKLRELLVEEDLEDDEEETNV